MLCVLILYISSVGGKYSIKSTPNNRFFAKHFMAVLLILRVFARNLLRGSNPGFSSNKAIHYLLDRGDLQMQCSIEITTLLVSKMKKFFFEWSRRIQAHQYSVTRDVVGFFTFLMLSSVIFSARINHRSA